MPLESYRQVRPWAKAIEQAILLKKMPPWFADPAIGKFANDPTLGEGEVAAISAWVAAGAPEGTPLRRGLAAKPISEWSIGAPDQVISMPRAIAIPRKGEIPYQYMVVPTGFPQDRWVRKVELLPGLRAAVHHAVVYIREPGSGWLRDAPRGAPFTVPPESSDAVTTSDLLFTYTPGAGSDAWPTGMAKLIPAGADLVFQMHYTALPSGGLDRTRLGMTFAAETPSLRVLTLQIGNDHFVIPPRVPNHRVLAWGTLPNDAVLLSLFPHMHLRGAGFEYRVVSPEGRAIPLLRLNRYDFQWQLTYRLAEPLALAAGTRLEVTGIFDNSPRNPRNPDPDAAVRFGFQSSEEMMIGFFDVAVPASLDKGAFFVRPGSGPPPSRLQ
jgi:hypothetical protein